MLDKTIPVRDTRPYSGYHNRPAPNCDQYITQVSAGTPGGEYLRKYWHPFLLSSELKDLPVPVRLLGEDLVVFRDKSSRLGLLHRHCVHRGSSLEFGIVAERGIRCCYHGWHFDVDGRILDTPAEPATSQRKNNLTQGAYPVREWQGLIFAYMGPIEDLPEFPTYDCVDHPQDNEVVPFSMSMPCNWVQIVENGSDPMHNAFLHAIVAGQQFSPAFKVLPQLDFPETPLGFLSMATRKVGDYVFVRSSDIILPNMGQFPNIGFAHLNSYNKSVRKMTKEDFGVDKIPFIGQTDNRPYHERQQEPGDFDAVVTQGPVANRNAEHLGTTDRGVVAFRRMLANAIKDHEGGKTPLKPRIVKQGTVSTYAHEIVLKIPIGVDLDDAKKLSEFGHRAAMAFVEFDALPPAQREEAVKHKVKSILESMASSS